jgi:hypothetical protein
MSLFDAMKYEFHTRRILDRLDAIDKKLDKIEATLATLAECNR